MTPSVTLHRVLFATLIPPLALALLSAEARQMDPGLSYTFTFIDNHSVRGQPVSDSSVGTEQFVGDNERRAYTQVPKNSGRPDDSLGRLFGLDPGTYVLQKRGRSTYTVVDTIRRQYADVDPLALMGSLTSVSFTQVLGSNGAVTATRVQPDSVVEGLRTEHWRLVDRHAVKMAVHGFDATFKRESTADYYIAPEFAHDVFATASGAGLPQPILAESAYSSASRAAAAQMPPGLTVLFIDSVTVSGEVGGRIPSSQIPPQSSVRMQRASNVQRLDIPADVFAIPPGYLRIERLAKPHHP